jgi:hypothetical protein
VLLQPLRVAVPVKTVFGGTVSRTRPKVTVRVVSARHVENTK